MGERSPIKEKRSLSALPFAKPTHILPTAVPGAQAFDTTPHAQELQAVWPHNMDVGRARDMSIVRFEAWGSINMEELEIGWSGSAYGAAAYEDAKIAWCFLEELQNVCLVALSFREKRTLGVSMLVDAGGMTTRHAKLSVVLNYASNTSRVQISPA